MGRTNTIVYGSPIDPRSAPSPRRGNLVQQPRVHSPPATARPHVDPPPRYNDGSPAFVRSPSASSPEPFEAQWFAPTNTNGRMMAIGNELEERRGWTPPPPSRGLTFAAVSLFLVGIAAAGTVFFLSPSGTKHDPPSVSTATVTNADVPPTTAETPAPSPAVPAPAETTTAAAAAKPVTPNDLPTAAPVATAPAAAAPAAASPVQYPKPATVASPPTKAATPSTRPTPKAEPRPVTAKRTGDTKGDTTLPDLDRAATAAGLTLAPDETSSAQGSTAPTPTRSSADTAASPQTPPADEGRDERKSLAPSTPVPSEAPPELEIKR